MTAKPDFGPQAQLVKELVAAVSDAQLDGPTPCPSYDVRTLLGHIEGLAAAFRDAGNKNLGASTNTDPGAALPQLSEDWRSRIPLHLQEMADAWSKPEAWEGETQAGGFTFPASEAGMVALNELLIHGWDLARATGRPYAPDAASIEVSYALLAPAADAPAEERGPFGPTVTVPADAPQLDRVIGLSGRNPSWTP